MCSRAAPMMTLPAELPAICTGSDPGAEVNITMSGPNEGFRRIGLRIFSGRFGPQLHSKDCYQHDDRVDRDSRKGDLFGDIAPYARSGRQAVSHHAPLLSATSAELPPFTSIHAVCIGTPRGGSCACRIFGGRLSPHRTPAAPAAPPGPVLSSMRRAGWSLAATEANSIGGRHTRV